MDSIFGNSQEPEESPLADDPCVEGCQPLPDRDSLIVPRRKLRQAILEASAEDINFLLDQGSHRFLLIFPGHIMVFLGDILWSKMKPCLTS